MSLAPQPTKPRSRWPKESRYWLALFGGAVAWLAHLLGSYSLAEFGCESVLAAYSYMGISTIACGLFALTLFMVLLAAGSALLAYRLHPSDRKNKSNETGFVARVYTARAGLIANIAFALVILVESVPIFYYLRNCG